MTLHSNNWANQFGTQKTTSLIWFSLCLCVFTTWWVLYTLSHV